jgi:hypothetical protein
VANKAIIDIALNAGEFERFTKLWNNYTEELEKQPELWQRLNSAMNGAGDAGESLAGGAITAKEAIALAGAQATIVAEALHEAVRAQNHLGDASHATNKRMSELAKTAKSFGSSIADLGKWVLRLGAGALTGLGVGTILGGFGIGELTNAAYTRSRAAGGLGLSPGQLAAFNVNAQPYLGPGALQGAASAQLSYQSAPYLQMLGIDFRRAQGMNAADLAFEMLRGAMKNWTDAQKGGLPPGSSPLVKAYEQLGGDLEDVRRAVLAGPGAINAAQSGYRRDVGALGFDRGTAAEWTQFKIQLDRAGMQIESVFIRRLAPLVPEFTELSKDIINAIAGFVESKEFGTLIGKMKDGLQTFVAWIEGPEPKKLWAGLGLVASEVMAVAEKLKWLVPQERKPVDPGKQPRPGMVWDAEKTMWIDPKTQDVYDPKTNLWDNYKGFGGNKFDWLNAPVGGPLGGPLAKLWSWITHATGSDMTMMRRTVAGYGQSYAAGADPAGDLANPKVAQNNLVAMLYGLGKSGFRPSIGWVKSGHHDDGPLQHAGGLAADINFINGQSVDSWMGKQAALALASSPLVRSLGLDPWIRSQKGTMAKIIAAWVASGHARGLLFNDSEGHIHASAYPDAVKKQADRMIRAIATHKPTQVSITNSTASRVSIAGNGVAMG